MRYLLLLSPVLYVSKLSYGYSEKDHIYMYVYMELNHFAVHLKHSKSTTIKKIKINIYEEFNSKN